MQYISRYEYNGSYTHTDYSDIDVIINFEIQQLPDITDTVFEPNH
jgi:hypothetical protein